MKEENRQELKRLVRDIVNAHRELDDVEVGAPGTSREAINDCQAAGEKLEAFVRALIKDASEYIRPEPPLMSISLGHCLAVEGSGPALTLRYLGWTKDDGGAGDVSIIVGATDEQLGYLRGHQWLFELRVATRVEDGK